MAGYHAGLDDDDDDFEGLDEDEGYEPDWDDEDEEWLSSVAHCRNSAL
jgi:hypothetical protein